MRNKILIFVVGMFAGLVIGVLFSVAIKALLSQLKEIHISMNKINREQNQLSQRLDSIQGKLVPDAKKTDNTTVQNNSKAKSSANSSRATEAQEGASKQSSDAGDESQPSEADDSDIIVMTNQLVSVESVELKNRDTTKADKKTERTDSAIAAMSDVNNSRENSDYRIEFWKSPLNYKGYKMSAGKIILYGINPVTPVSLALLEGSYYLQVNQNAYKVDFTDDYKPFERVTDKALLKKLGYED